MFCKALKFLRGFSEVRTVVLTATKPGVTTEVPSLSIFCPCVVRVKSTCHTAESRSPIADWQHLELQGVVLKRLVMASRLR